MAGRAKALTYATTADFTFTTTAPEALYLNLLGENASGVGFDSLELQISADGSVSDYTFTVLSAAEAFFTDDSLDLGAIDTGSHYVDLSYWLIASEPGAGFGFAYDLAPSAVPEPSTWAMMLLGFAGLGYAGYRRTRSGQTALSAA